jgi:hypothetical protein
MFVSADFENHEEGTKRRTGSMTEARQRTAGGMDVPEVWCKGPIALGAGEEALAGLAPSLNGPSLTVDLDGDRCDIRADGEVAEPRRGSPPPSLILHSC